jgi:hypothetical protein
MKFYQTDLSKETLWRAIILFGRNVASYKFALGESLLALASEEKTRVTLEELAPRFSASICRHIKETQKQGTFKSSNFLNACNDFNDGKIAEDALIQITVRQGFNNVIDAFHVVNREEVPVRFFRDERTTSKGIMLTDELLSLVESRQFGNLPHEVEARWRLVETAWSLGVAPSLLQVSYVEDGEMLVFRDETRRVAISSCRNALNGYQKGQCFYSADVISVESIAPNLCDVDHFFPHKLKEYPEFRNINIDGVWNLVLSCKDCNRGFDGKFAKVPSLKLLERLHCRNEYYISSHHPLRETIINQTGFDEKHRRDFLQRVFDMARSRLIHTWEPCGGSADEAI